MSRQVQINVSTLVNASKIRREKRDGRDVIIVPSATLPDNVVMNGIRYPAEVIAESYQSLEGTLAPLGHPMVNGKYVSAKSAEALARNYIGAHNENVRRENGRVFLDKVIDVEVANQSARGKSVLEAIEKQEPMHTSTGLLATLKPLTNAADGATSEVTSMVLDHDCIFLDQPGAATPDQGVGMFVNAAGDELEVVNSMLEDDIDRQPNWQVDDLLRTIERKERLPLLERTKVAIVEAVRGAFASSSIPAPAMNASEESMDKAQFDALMADIAEIKGRPVLDEAKVTELVNAAVKPMIDAQTARDEADKAKAAEEHTALVNRAVEAGLLEEADAKATPAAVLNALLDKQKLPAMRVNGAFRPAPKQTDRAALAPKGE